MHKRFMIVYTMQNHIKDLTTANYFGYSKMHQNQAKPFHENNAKSFKTYVYYLL